MNISATTIGKTQGIDKATVAMMADLTKARLSSLVVLTTAAGYYLGSAGPINGWAMAHALLGTGLLAGGAGALNQYLERAYDARMQRTASRPLPAGLIKAETALLLGGVMSVTGLIWLALLANLATAVLGAITLMTYLFIYTPLKRRTAWNTVAGAVPGALPPVMGWTAAGGEIGGGGLLLFAIQFCWQMPHFLAIAWLYRDDYQRAGFRMLAVTDSSGQRTARQTVHFTVALAGASVLPALFGVAGGIYLGGALLLSAAFLLSALSFGRSLTPGAARQLFLASILYQPLVLGLMVFDKISR